MINMLRACLAFCMAAEAAVPQFEALLASATATDVQARSAAVRRQATGCVLRPRLSTCTITCTTAHRHCERVARESPDSLQTLLLDANGTFACKCYVRMQEAILLLKLMSAMSVPTADESLHKMLALVFTKDAAIREAVLDAFTELYLTFVRPVR